MSGHTYSLDLASLGRKLEKRGKLRERKRNGRQKEGEEESERKK